MLPPPPRSTLFPYTTLFRSDHEIKILAYAFQNSTIQVSEASRLTGRTWQTSKKDLDRLMRAGHLIFWPGEDRKSTRLNSSHVEISYAVFCLKKKKINIKITN